MWADFINCPKHGEDRRSVGDWRKVVDELDILVMTGVQKYDGHRSKYPVKQAKSRDLVAHNCSKLPHISVRLSAPIRGLSSHWWKYKKVWYDSREVLLPALCHSIFCRVHVDQRPSCVVFTARFTIVQSVVLRLHVVRLSVCLSVTMVDQDHIRWKCWKLIVLNKTSFIINLISLRLDLMFFAC